MGCGNSVQEENDIDKQNNLEDFPEISTIEGQHIIDTFPVKKKYMNSIEVALDFSFVLLLNHP